MEKAHEILLAAEEHLLRYSLLLRAARCTQSADRVDEIIRDIDFEIQMHGQPKVQK